MQRHDNIIHHETIYVTYSLMIILARFYLFSHRRNWIIKAQGTVTHTRAKNPETYRKGERHTKTRNEYLVNIIHEY